MLKLDNTKTSRPLITRSLSALFAFTMLTACDQIKRDGKIPNPMDRQTEQFKNVGKFFGEDALVFDATDKISNKKETPSHQASDKTIPSQGQTISQPSKQSDLNQHPSNTPYLWKGAISALRDMPLQTIDHQSGLLITEWIVNKNTPNNRIKVTVELIDSSLHSKSVSVTVLPQEFTNNQWVSDTLSKEHKKLQETIADDVLSNAKRLFKHKK